MPRGQLLRVGYGPWTIRAQAFGFSNDARGVRVRSGSFACARTERQPKHLEHSALFGLVAVADVSGAHPLIKTARVWLGLPFESLCSEFKRARADVREEQAPQAVTDPAWLDPEILEPADLAARDQGRPANRLTFSLVDSGVDKSLAQALGFELPTSRPLLYECRFV